MEKKGLYPSIQYFKNAAAGKYGMRITVNDNFRSHVDKITSTIDKLFEDSTASAIELEQMRKERNELREKLDQCEKVEQVLELLRQLL